MIATTIILYVMIPNTINKAIIHYAILIIPYSPLLISISLLLREEIIIAIAIRLATFMISMMTIMDFIPPVILKNKGTMKPLVSNILFRELLDVVYQGFYLEFPLCNNLRLFNNTSGRSKYISQLPKRLWTMILFMEAKVKM